MGPSAENNGQSTPTDYTGRAARVTEAIRDGKVKQVKLSEYCECSEQAVARWKKTGQMDSLNRYRLSEMSGYRYLYLRDGTGPKKYQKHSDNLEEFLTSGDFKPVTGIDAEDDAPELANLIAKLRVAHKARLLTSSSLSVLSSLVSELAK
jgi:hypothetical protein